MNMPLIHHKQGKRHFVASTLGNGVAYKEFIHRQTTVELSISHMIPSLKRHANFLAATCAVIAVITVATPATDARAEATLSVYGGANFSPHSRVKYNETPALPQKSVLVGWDGASFKMPPYYGVRATWWLDQMPEVGLAIDFTHAKVAADPLPAAFSTLEFTDGINFLTANVLYRYQMDNGFTPYAGIGAGIAVPHVEVDGPTFPAGGTFEYQVTGVAAQALIGVDYKLDDNWSVFTEFKSTYGVVDADLTGGGSLSTDIISNQVLFGITYKLF